jgi:alkylhydroperoxidase family enzyme
VRIRTPRIAPLSNRQLRELDPRVIAEFHTLDLICRQPMNAFGVQAHNGPICSRWFALIRTFLHEGRLPPRDRELVILRVAARRRCPAVWGFHCLISYELGIPVEVVDRVARGPREPGWDAADAALLRAADVILDTARLPERQFADLRSRYDDAQLVELTLLIGLFAANCAFLETLQVPIEDGLPSLPDEPSA